MSNDSLRSLASLFFLLMVSPSVLAEVRDNYELTVASVVKAVQGWQLYSEKKFAGAFQNGHYTDPDSVTKVKDFWSDGQIAKLDRDGNGHFETVFTIVDKQLVYAGSIGSKGTVIHAARDYKKYIGQPAPSFIRNIYQSL